MAKQLSSGPLTVIPTSTDAFFLPEFTSNLTRQANSFGFLQPEFCEASKGRTELRARGGRQPFLVFTYILNINNAVTSQVENFDPTQPCV